MLEGFHEVTDTLRCGVYVLMHHEEVVYVGKAKVMLGRIYGHRTAWGSKRRVARTAIIPPRGILFNRVFIRPCPLAVVDALESALIATHRPRYNTQLKPPMPPELTALVQHLVPAIATTVQPRFRISRRGF